MSSCAVSRSVLKSGSSRHAILRSLWKDLPRSARRGTGQAMQAPHLSAAIVRGLAISVLLAGALLLGRKWGLGGTASSVPRMTQLTWRNGYVLSGRFAPDGEVVVYGARWEDNPARVYSARMGSVESRPLEIEGTVLSISSTGEMALLLGTRYDGTGNAVCGTLAQSSLGGGAPRPLIEGVRGADWAPDSRELAVVRCGDVYSLEFPLGHPIATSALLLYPRVSRDGVAGRRPGAFVRFRSRLRHSRGSPRPPDQTDRGIVPSPRPRLVAFGRRDLVHLSGWPRRRGRRSGHAVGQAAPSCEASRVCDPSRCDASGSSPHLEPASAGARCCENRVHGQRRARPVLAGWLQCLRSEP